MIKNIFKFGIITLVNKTGTFWITNTNCRYFWTQTHGPTYAASKVRHLRLKDISHKARRNFKITKFFLEKRVMFPPTHPIPETFRNDSSLKHGWRRNTVGWRHAHSGLVTKYRVGSLLKDERLKSYDILPIPHRHPAKHLSPCVHFQHTKSRALLAFLLSWKWKAFLEMKRWMFKVSDRNSKPEGMVKIKPAPQC
jgi:hypothetical protein